MQNRYFFKKTAAMCLVATIATTTWQPAVHAAPPAYRTIGRTVLVHLISDFVVRSAKQLAMRVLRTPFPPPSFSDYAIPLLENLQYSATFALFNTTQSTAMGYITHGESMSVADQQGLQFVVDNHPLHAFMFAIGYLVHMANGVGYVSRLSNAQHRLRHQKSLYTSEAALLLVGLMYLGKHATSKWLHAIHRGVLQRTFFPAAPPASAEESARKCAICRETDGSFISPCQNKKHLFHSGCFREWALVVRSCPLCKSRNLRAKQASLLQALFSLYTDDAIREVCKKTVRVYGPVAAGLVAGLLLQRRAIGELDTVHFLGRS